MAHRAVKAAAGLGLAVAGVGAYRRWVRPWMNRWGAAAHEADARLPGDALVDAPQATTTRAVTVAAPPSAVWPWLVQMGQARGGFYSYDWLERLSGLDVHNADRIHPEWQTLVVGDIVRLSPTSRMIAAQVEPEETLVLYQDVPLPLDGVADVPDALQWSWAFVLRPKGAHTTRLIVRVRANWEPGGWLGAVLAPVVEAVHFVMERGMLRGIRERAERTYALERTPTQKP